MRQIVCDLLQLLGCIVFGLLPPSGLRACAAETLHLIAQLERQMLNADLLPGNWVRQMCKARSSAAWAPVLPSVTHWQTLH